MTLDKESLWTSIAALSTISNSQASETQRMLSKTYNHLNSLGLASPSLPQSVTVKPLIESTTGKLVTTVA